jgi:general secretion pathway protein I
VRRGFTLLEMIVATLIMGIAIVGMLSGLAGATRNAARLFERDRAVQLARAKMNDLIADREIPGGQIVSGEFAPAETGGVESGWRARISVFEKPPVGGPGAMLLDRIELEIWWMAGRDRRTFTLDGYRSRFASGTDYGMEATP